MVKRAASTLILLFGLAGASLVSQGAWAQGNTVKTNHGDVNLWSEPGRWAGEPMDQIRRFEEVQVTGSKKLKNGEEWYRVQIRRFPEGGAKTEKTGWVNSKYFTDLDTPVIDDQPPENVLAAQASCTDCPIVEDNLKGDKLQTQVKNFAAIQKKATARSEYIWPVGGTLRSGFGYRQHPIKRVVKMHTGMDIAGNNGAKVKAAKAGVIEVSVSGCRVGKRSCGGGYGNRITINHGDGTKTTYAHLSASCRLPKQGTRVAQGAIIGCVGATGLATGPHLHFEVRRHGRLINPLSVLPKKAKRSRK